jgi:hypothetical protein
MDRVIEESLVELMVADLMANKMVAIGFNERQDKDTVERLKKLKNLYPELIDPLLTTGYRGTGEIHFALVGNVILCEIYADMDDTGNQYQVMEMNITIERFRAFACSTESFAVFINDNGNNDLNI